MFFPLSGRREDQEHGALGFSSYRGSAQHILCMVKEILVVTGQVSRWDSPMVNIMMKGLKQHGIEIHRLGMKGKNERDGEKEIMSKEDFAFLLLYSSNSLH